MKLLKESIVNKKVPVTAIVLIMLFSLCVRFPGFFRPHLGNDEVQYLALAMKLELFGFKGYNLRGVKKFVSGDGNFTAVFPVRESENGTILKGLPRFYDLPLYHKPPLFIAVLSNSHTLFAFAKPYAVVAKKITLKNNIAQLASFMKTQFYCTCIPIFFSLFLILMTFILGSLLFSNKVGIYSAILLSISPIEILSSQNIWNDDMLAFFVAAAFLLYYTGTAKPSIAYIFLSGICAGLASLTKPSGNCIIPAIIVFELWRKRIRSWALVVFLITSILVALPWYALIVKTYGSLFFIPLATDPSLTHNYPWFNFVLNRPWYMYLVNIPAQTPLLALIYPAMFGVFRKCANSEKLLGRDIKIFLFIWFAVFLSLLLLFRVGKELRYMLPAYPAMTILAASTLQRIEYRINHLFKSSLGSVLVIMMIMACSCWSILIGIKWAALGLGEIRFPL